MKINKTHDINAKSWVKSANSHSDFPIQNLPWGIFIDENEKKRIGVAIGDFILDIKELISLDLMDGISSDLSCALSSTSLNSLMSLGKKKWEQARNAIFNFLESSNQSRYELLRNRLTTKMANPVQIGDFTDFYASRHHATNVGKMFRPDGDPLLPNYLNLPVGYHGRSSSIVVSGTKIIRPSGQLKPLNNDPIFGPCNLLDYELECGAFLGGGNKLGERIEISNSDNHLFGLVILNDWSARDIQKWEYQPLGPFNAKNFATSISPWIITYEALAPFREKGPKRDTGDPQLLNYLQPVNQDVIRATFEVFLETEKMRSSGLKPQKISTGNLADLSWSFAQMLSHHTSTGCPFNPGDLIGSGTLSGKSKDSRGCLLELTWKGTDPLKLVTGEERKFLLDGDNVIMKAFAIRDGFAQIGFGECQGQVSSAI